MLETPGHDARQAWRRTRELDNGVVFLAKQTRTTPAVTIQPRRAGGLGVRSAGCAGRDVAAVARHRSRHRQPVGAEHRRRAGRPRRHADGRRHATCALARLHLPRRRFRRRCSRCSPTSSCTRRSRKRRSRQRKGEVVTAIRQDEDNPAVRATEALMALLYPDGHPYGRRTKGSVEIVGAH